METIVLKFDPDAKCNIEQVYHGTRTPTDVLLNNGLQYPDIQTILKWIKKSMGVVGLSYDKWLENQEKMIKTGKLCILREMQQEYRKVIWVTANFETDMRYAERSPELVSEAIRNEYTRLHYRRKNVLDEANEIVLKGIAWFGEPKVVILNAKKIGATGGHNEPTKSYISSDAIEKIVIRLFKQNQL